MAQHCWLLLLMLMAPTQRHALGLERLARANGLTALLNPSVSVMKMGERETRGASHTGARSKRRGFRLPLNSQGTLVYKDWVLWCMDL